MMTVQRARNLRSAQLYTESEMEQRIRTAATHTDFIVVDSSRVSEALRWQLKYDGYLLLTTADHRVDDNLGLKISWERL